MSVVDTRHPSMAESVAPQRPDREASLAEAQKLKDKIEKLRANLVRIANRHSCVGLMWWIG